MSQFVGERIEGVSDLGFGKSMIYSFWIGLSIVVSLLLPKRETMPNFNLPACVVSQCASAPLKPLEDPPELLVHCQQKAVSIALQ